MATARVEDQLVAKMPDRVGALADVTEALSAAGANMSAICAYGQEGTGEFMLMTSDDETVAEALRNLGAEVSTEKVVVAEMPDAPGALAAAARAIAQDGIQIGYVYGTVAPGATSAVAVFRVADEDAERAAAAIR